MRRSRAKASSSKSGKSPAEPDQDLDIEALSTDCSQDEADEPQETVTQPTRSSGRRPGPKAPYKFQEAFREDHGKNLFAIQFNQFNREQDVFATAGANRVSIYECLKPTGVQLLRMFVDPAEDECFYSLSWTHDRGLPVIAVGGKRAVIRILYPSTTGFSSDEMSYTGHGHAINHLIFNHAKPHILLSASKDHDMRLWNIKTHTCLAILGGVEGHMDEVLYAEFSSDGNRIVSCGMDHFLKLWNLDRPQMKKAIEASSTYDKRSKKTFEYYRDHFPIFSTRDIHSNYIDCVLDFGKFIISKSCENEVVFWRPGTVGEQSKSSATKNTVTIVARLPVKDCDIWFLRVTLDREKRTMALGNLIGKIYVWNLAVEDPKKIRPSLLTHPNSTAAIRQTSFSPNSENLVACADDGTVWMWKKT